MTDPGTLGMTDGKHTETWYVVRGRGKHGPGPS
eukprot:CAMPEP_0116893902 /NCGR_PEP_ID=MMETSP0467-20121206/3793_1 /TAXON_ID=283647 /ORGANISM="Mesodinium pulex, Strain SPMC105" /LENGTH=32 /DNA_ID= /DNA_START= /DNA_END= /DNA_ORIENTATION=